MSNLVKATIAVIILLLLWGGHVLLSAPFRIASFEKIGLDRPKN